MVGHFIVLLHVMYHNYNLVSLGFKLHNVHTIIIMSSTCFLFMIAQCLRKRFEPLDTFDSIFYLNATACISLDCIACCPVSLSDVVTSIIPTEFGKTSYGGTVGPVVVLGHCIKGLR